MGVFRLDTSKVVAASRGITASSFIHCISRIDKRWANIRYSSIFINKSRNSFQDKRFPCSFLFITDPFNRHTKMEQIHIELRPQLNVRHRSCHSCMSIVVWSAIPYIQVEGSFRHHRSRTNFNSRSWGSHHLLQVALRQARGIWHNLRRMRRSRTIQANAKARLWMFTDE